MDIFPTEPVNRFPTEPVNTFPTEPLDTSPTDSVDTFSPDTLLHPLTTEGEVVLPAQFTYPFLYAPHPLAVQAAETLKAYLKTRPDWQEEIGRGKMFGVLVVENPNQETTNQEPQTTNHKPQSQNPKPKPQNPNTSFLAAFSGLLSGRNFHPGFVPPVYDLQTGDPYFQTEDAEISRMADGEEKSLRSRRLQQWLFRQFNFLNARGERTNLCDIFAQERCLYPPSGAGECCAPKLLQHAFANGLRPLCMAEFWLGASPKGEVRYDGEYYPACQAKCKPILRHMLQGLDVEENLLLPMMRRAAERMRIIYDDPWLIAIDKPAGMLAVRGNVDAPSVESKIQEIYPDLSGPLIVHRLDMDTSGIMLIAKTKEIHKELQAEFYRHEIRKRYVAVLDGLVQTDRGVISLPLAPSKTDRPRQVVNHEYGKPATTEFEVLERKVIGNITAEIPSGKSHVPAAQEVQEAGKQNPQQISGRTLIAFYPLTGRTHQLRVHAASSEGLACPIVGDRLYSRGSMTRQEPMTLAFSRMLLHAETITFIHPISKAEIHLQSPHPFIL